MQEQKSPDGPKGWAAFSNFRSTQAVASVTPPWDPGPETRGDGRRRPTGKGRKWQNWQESNSLISFGVQGIVTPHDEKAVLFLGMSTR